MSLHMGMSVWRSCDAVVGVGVERSGLQPARAGHLVARGDLGGGDHSHVIESRAVGKSGCEGEEEGEGEEEVEEAKGVELHLEYLWD